MQFDLVFEGGGAKGMVLVGAMQEHLAERDPTPERRRRTTRRGVAAPLQADQMAERVLGAM